MKIAIDLDGVIFDTDRTFCAYAELYDILHNGKGKQKECRYVEEAYGWSDEQFKDFIGNHFDLIYRDAPVMPLAKEILARLKNDGHQLYIITNRTALADKEQDMTYQRFKKEGLAFDAIEFTKQKKSLMCKKHNIDIMIDNTPEVVDDISENDIKCIYFRDNTREIIHKNVFEVHNWAEIYRLIKNLTKK